MKGGGLKKKPKNPKYVFFSSKKKVTKTHETLWGKKGNNSPAPKLLHDPQLSHPPSPKILGHGGGFPKSTGGGRATWPGRVWGGTWKRGWGGRGFGVGSGGHSSGHTKGEPRTARKGKKTRGFARDKRWNGHWGGVAVVWWWWTDDSEDSFIFIPSWSPVGYFYGKGSSQFFPNMKTQKGVTGFGRGWGGRLMGGPQRISPGGKGGGWE